MTVEFVLDASALLAVVLGEPGGDVAWSLSGRSVVGAVNYSEALTKLIRRTGDPRESVAKLAVLRLDVVPFDEQLAWEGTDLAPYAWTHGLSTGDRACLTLARQLGVPAVTADHAWDIPGLPVQVRFIR